MNKQKLFSRIFTAVLVILAVGAFVTVLHRATIGDDQFEKFEVYHDSVGIYINAKDSVNAARCLDTCRKMNIEIDKLLNQYGSGI